MLATKKFYCNKTSSNSTLIYTRQLKTKVTKHSSFHKILILSGILSSSQISFLCNNKSSLTGKNEVLVYLHNSQLEDYKQCTPPHSVFVSLLRKLEAVALLLGFFAGLLFLYGNCQYLIILEMACLMGMRLEL